jgi:hypothetical protein
VWHVCVFFGVLFRFGVVARPTQGGEIHQRVNTERWTEDLFGEGPQSALSHVIIPDDMLAKLPAALVSEMNVLDEIDDELRTDK